MKYLKEAGARLMIGAPGPEMTKEFEAFALEHGISSFILFADDIVSREQTLALCAALDDIARKNSGMRALIAADQEGGAVERLPKGDFASPSAGELAATGDPKRAFDAGRRIAEALLGFGINFDLAPVMDIDCKNGNPVVGSRSFGPDAATVSRFGAAMIRGLRAGGALSCAKHFPGHGGTSVDTHKELPSIGLSERELRAGPALPFVAAAEAGVSAIMTTHILFPKIDEEYPSTMSRAIITGILRDKLGFDGLVLTDCLEMGAIVKHYGTAKGALMAAKAGVDMPLISHTPALAAEAARLIAEALENGEISKEEHARSIERIAEVKKWKAS